MRKISFIVTSSGTINAVADGKSFSIPPDHHNYIKVKHALVNDDVADFIVQANLAEAIKQYTAPAAADATVGEVSVVDGKVMWQGKEMHNAVSKRIISLQEQGFPFDPMLRFLGNLMKNPSYRSCMELYNFLDREGLPVTDDGCFLGYKRVRDDWKDLHTGTVDNSIGKIIEMPRNMVDDNWMNDCSAGYHVGSIDYVRGFHGGSGHVLIVKVNPADVVSVPQYATNKLRTCKYEVLKEYDRDLIDPLKETLYTSSGEELRGKDVVNSGGIDQEELDKRLDDISNIPPYNAVISSAYDHHIDDDMELDDDDDDSELDEEEYDDDEDDEYDDLNDEDEDEAEQQKAIATLVQEATLRDVNPFRLAFKLGLRVDDFQNDPTLEQVIKLAYIEDGWSESFIRERF